MLTAVDYVIIVVYLLGVAVLGIRLAGRQVTTEDYFLGGRNLPWWVVCFSTVATETSTLTVIGLPAVAYGGSLTCGHESLAPRGRKVGRSHLPDTTSLAFVVRPNSLLP